MAGWSDYLNKIRYDGGTAGDRRITTVVAYLHDNVDVIVSQNARRELGVPVALAFVACEGGEHRDGRWMLCTISSSMLHQTVTGKPHHKLS